MWSQNHSPITRLRLLALALLMLSEWLGAAPIRILAWDDEIAARKLAIADSKGSVDIVGMHPAKRTRFYQLATSEKPVSIQALDRKDKDDKPPASEIRIPQGFKQPLLLLLPDEKSSTGLRLFVLDDDTSGFPWGSIRFVNATGKKLAFGFEKKTVVLPASWDPVLARPGGENRNMETQLFLFDEPTEPIYSAVWEQQQDIRTLVFLVPGEDPRLGPVAMKMILEDRRVVEAKPPADAAK